MKDNWIRKIPWGILAGSFAILLFFCLVGTIAAFIVLDMMAGETSMHATLFDEWYQVVLFIGVVIGGAGFIGSTAMFIVRKVKLRAPEGGKDGGVSQ